MNGFALGLSDYGDPSVPLALAALVQQADDEGRAPFAPFAAAYRGLAEGVLVGPGGEAPELSGDEVHDNLTQSVLPRLLDAGLVSAPGPEGWVVVRALGDWWPSARADRMAASGSLLEAARLRADLRRRVGPPAAHLGPVPGGSVLEGTDLCKSFKRRRVVDNVSVHLQQGEIVGLLGPNGAGKTTTFYLITGLIRPDAGQVTLDGAVLTRAPMYQRARRGLGYLAQEPSVFRRLTVEENIIAILETLDVSRQERRERLERLLDELSIKHLRKNKAYSLSGGERRRLEITRALVTDPKFMLLDEPFAGVDPIAVHDIQTIVAGLRHRGIGVLITDHNVEQTFDIVDRAYIMFEGKVQVSGPVRDLVYDDRVAQLYLGPTLTARLRARLEKVA
jgi:lipopolysaccharide export system ATP-binding protein